MKNPFRILSCDLLIADVVTELEGNAELAALVKELGLKPGGKTTINKEQFNRLAAAVQGHAAEAFPGGSSANMLTTLSQLMGDRVAIDFIGRAGAGHFGAMISQAMEAANIRMIEPATPEDEVPQPAITYVIKYADGERTTATYPGNTHEVITPKMLTESMVEKADAVFMQGSLWEKFDPAFAHRMLVLRNKHKKELWLALPTRAGFGVKRQDMFKAIIPGSNLVLANIAELSRIGGIINEHVKEGNITTAQKQQALAKLQQVFGKRQLGFITDGKHGAWVVTKDTLIHADTVNKSQIENTVGAGDTAYAGFLYGYLKKLPHKDSAHIAMALAGEKLKCNGARLPDAKAILNRVLKSLS